jgi:hypothetical protein
MGQTKLSTWLEVVAFVRCVISRIHHSLIPAHELSLDFETEARILQELRRKQFHVFVADPL